MSVRRARRIATGAMLLAVGATKLLPPATRSLALTFGGALFGASLVQTPATGALAEVPVVTVSQVLASQPEVPTRPRHAALGALVVLMVLGAGGLIAYPWLTHQNSGRIQASRGGAVLKDTVGRPVAARVDPQLHIVGLGQTFSLYRARIRVQAASLCRGHSMTTVAVPAYVQALHRGEGIGEPQYQLLDAHGVPHQPSSAVALDARQGTPQHAAPPPSVYHELINFRLPADSAQGTLRLQAVLASGTGPEYRVTVAGSHVQASPPADGNAPCISPGVQGA